MCHLIKIKVTLLTKVEHIRKKSYLDTFHEVTIRQMFLIFHYGGRYHIETRPMIKSVDGFLYDNGPRHEKVK